MTGKRLTEAVIRKRVIAFIDKNLLTSFGNAEEGKSGQARLDIAGIEAICFKVHTNADVDVSMEIGN